MRPWLKCVRFTLNEFPKRGSSNALRAFSTNLSASNATRLIIHNGVTCRNVKPSWPVIKNVKPYSSIGLQNEDTIYALSTAPGRAAIAIVRISGRAALNVYQALCPAKPAPRPRHATLRTLYSPSPEHGHRRVLDSGALVLYFPAPETVTGEDVLELHVHGGPAIVKAVLAAIPETIPNEQSQQHRPLIRYAEPGEFTRRAFYNGRLDLTQIEALGDTLSAETEQQRRLAIRGSSSALATRYEAWRQKLLLARGELEALIDFSEDQHFDESPAELCSSVAGQVMELMGQVKASIESATRGELLRNGINIALVGAPNAGKSSLLNCIVGREAAIVSPEAGTTRDVVDVSVDIGGYLCRFGDLAGLRKAGTDDGGRGVIGAIEQEGMRRATERALTAEVVIVILRVQPLPHPTSNTDKPSTEMGVTLEPPLADLLSNLDFQSQKVVCVINKIDLLPSSSPSAITDLCTTLLSQNSPLDRALSSTSNKSIFPISCHAATAAAAPTPPPSSSPQPATDADPGNIQAFLRGLTDLFSTMTSTTPDQQNSSEHQRTSTTTTTTTTTINNGNNNYSNALWTESIGATERQRLLLQECWGHLEQFLATVQGPVHPAKDAGTDADTDTDTDVDIVLAAESLRSAGACLARITGRGEGAGDVEEVLGVVFERFCVGK